MPRRPAGIPAETLAQRFARRVEEEAERRGMSDAGLAKRASVHYPMTASTIWKIKNADPPRRVDIDEATAIAVGAFEYASIESFLLDSPLEPFRAAMRELEKNVELIGYLIEKSVLGVKELFELVGDPEAHAALRGGRAVEVEGLSIWAESIGASLARYGRLTGELEQLWASMPEGLRSEVDRGK